MASRANSNYLQDYYRRNKDAHYVDKRQAGADNAVAEELHGQVIAVDVRVRAVEIRVRLALDVGHLYGPVYEPYASQSPEQALRRTRRNDLSPSLRSAIRANIFTAGVIAIIIITSLYSPRAIVHLRN